MVYYILPTIITPIGKLFVCIQHSSLLLYVPLLLKKAFIIFVLALYSSDENHFISWRTIYGPTSCFFFTLNTLMYTVIICTHIYLYIHTHSFPELLKKQYIYLTCIYLLLDRTMIAYLFHTLFMNINRTEIQHMVHISTNARGKINFQPTFMHSFIIKRACNNIWSHLMKVSLKTCIRSFYKKILWHVIISSTVQLISKILSSLS